MNINLPLLAPGRPRSLPAGPSTHTFTVLALVLVLLTSVSAGAQDVLLHHPDGSVAWIHGELGTARLPTAPEEPDEAFYEEAYFALHRALQDALVEHFGTTGEESFELASMTVRQTQRANIGNLELRQTMSGLPVVDSNFRARIDMDSGQIQDIHGRVYPWKEEYSLRSIPQIPFRDALARALAELKAQGDVLEDPELVFVGGRKDLVLAYRVLVSLSISSAPEFLSMNASDGRVLGLDPTQLTAPPTGPGDTNYPWPNINSTQKFRSYDLIVALSNLLCSTTVHFPIPGFLMIPIGPCTPDDSVARAHENAIQVYRFFRETEGWKSYDGKGSDLVSVANKPMVNAYWSKTKKEMHYGEGDDNILYDLTLGFDVAAHEMAHGVTQERNGLVYNRQSGALNEAYSDIFAAAAEAWQDGAITADTFLIGEDVAGPALGPALRYMHDPSLDGKSPDYFPDRLCPDPNCVPQGGGPINATCTGPNDYCAVHYNSGIANLAFYLLVNGGTHPQGKTSIVVPGIGMEKARSIYFEAHGHLTEDASFLSLRLNTEQAAADLYDAATVEAVGKSWSAVGVTKILIPPPGSWP